MKYWLFKLICPFKDKNFIEAYIAFMLRQHMNVEHFYNNLVRKDFENSCARAAEEFMRDVF